MSTVTHLSYNGELLSLPCKPLGPKLQNAQPSPQHRNSREILYPRIPHTVVAGPGASDHRATSQIEGGGKPGRPACRRL